MRKKRKKINQMRKEGEYMGMMTKPKKMSAFTIDRTKVKAFYSDQSTSDWERIYKMAKTFETNQETHKKK